MANRRNGPLVAAFGAVGRKDEGRESLRSLGSVFNNECPATIWPSRQREEAERARMATPALVLRATGSPG
jgi:hypothetical protein